MENKFDKLLDEIPIGNQMIVGIIDGDRLFDNSLITPDDVNNPPVAALAILENDEIKIIGSTKAAIVVQGPAKGGKGKSYTIFLIACLVGMFGPFISKLVGRKIVVMHSDDHRYNLALMAFEISRLAGVEKGFHENLIMLSVSQLNIAEKYATLDSLLTKHPNIGTLVLDLAWDWIDSVNDEQQSKIMLDTFLALAARHDFLLIVVTHEARMSRAAKGHQGSHWVAKAQSVLRVRKRQQEFIISPLFLRGKDFSEIRFTYNGSNYSFVDNKNEEGALKTSKGDFTAVDDEIHFRVLQSINQDGDWAPGRLRELLRTAYSQLVHPIGENLSKTLLKYYKDRNWILTEGRRYRIRHGLEVVLKTPPYHTTVQPAKPLFQESNQNDNLNDNAGSIIQNSSP